MIGPGRSRTPVEIVAAWFADALTWESFQTTSDEEMAESMLAALTEAGYWVVPLVGLLDVAVAALGAVEHLTGNDGRSEWLLAEKVERIVQRAGLTPKEAS